MPLDLFSTASGNDDAVGESGKCDQTDFTAFLLVGLVGQQGVVRGKLWVFDAVPFRRKENRCAVGAGELDIPPLESRQPLPSEQEEPSARRQLCAVVIEESFLNALS